MTIKTAGRTDIHDFFKLSGIRDSETLPHHPFLVFVENPNGKEGLEVVIVHSAKNLLEYTDNTKVMAQWGGQWRSDFFQFTIGEFKDYITKNPPESYQII